MIIHHTNHSFSSYLFFVEEYRIHHHRVESLILYTDSKCDWFLFSLTIKSTILVLYNSYKLNISISIHPLLNPYLATFSDKHTQLSISYRISLFTLNCMYSLILCTSKSFKQNSYSNIQYWYSMSFKMNWLFSNHEFFYKSMIWSLSWLSLRYYHAFYPHTYSLYLLTIVFWEILHLYHKQAITSFSNLFSYHLFNQFEYCWFYHSFTSLTLCLFISQIW